MEKINTDFTNDEFGKLRLNISMCANGDVAPITLILEHLTGCYTIKIC